MPDIICDCDKWFFYWKRQIKLWYSNIGSIFRLLLSSQSINERICESIVHVHIIYLYSLEKKITNRGTLRSFYYRYLNVIRMRVIECTTQMTFLPSEKGFSSYLFEFSRKKFLFILLCFVTSVGSALHRHNVVVEASYH